MGINRRTVLRGATLMAGLAALPFDVRQALAQDASGTVFSFDALIARARDGATLPYKAPYQPLPDVVKQIDYDAWGKITFNTDEAPFSGNPDTQGTAGYPLEFFHLGQYFTKSVKMNLILDGKTVEVPYNPALFNMPEDSVAKSLPADSGYAGFRLQEWHTSEDWTKQDWVAFLGASYFRAIGAAGQYGLSARGVAINALLADKNEEFPDFTEFFIEEQADPEAPVTVYAYLDGPSITGAYRFLISRGIDRTQGVTMEIESQLFLRENVERLGLMPMTSMFWYSEYGRERMRDWRPEIHDSDGLAMWTGTGERLWRPLNNPAKTTVSAFMDENPRGFGLLQRDRNFDHYQDGVFYDRRPCLWLEPLKPLGRGSVQLLEIPTNDEIHDNIGLIWVPEAPATKGSSYSLHYKLFWLNEEPYEAENIAQTVATRVGTGGEPGKPRPDNQYRIAVEFDRPSVMQQIPYGIMPKVNVSTSQGRIIRTQVEPVPNGNVWRAMFDLELMPDLNTDLRLYLDLDGKPLTETWTYQFNGNLASFNK